MQHLVQKVQLGSPGTTCLGPSDPHKGRAGGLNGDMMEATTSASLGLSAQFSLGRIIASDLLSWLEEGSFKDPHVSLPTVIALTPSMGISV